MHSFVLTILIQIRGEAT